LWLVFFWCIMLNLLWILIVCILKSSCYGLDVEYFFFSSLPFFPQKNSFPRIFYYILYLLNVFFLGLVLIIGKDVNGAKAWIDLKYFNFQPSELMKLTYSLFLAHFISNKKFKNWWDEFLFLVLICIFFAVPSILIFLEPDTGAIIFLGISLKRKKKNKNINIGKGNITYMSITEMLQKIYSYITKC